MNSLTYQARRSALAQQSDGSLFVLSAHGLLQRANDTYFLFQQEANFLYLTGIDAADWWLIFDAKDQKSWLVAPDSDVVHEVFEGSLSWQAARATSGVDHVISRAEARSLLQELAKRHRSVHAIGPDPHKKQYNFSLNPAPIELWRYLKRTFDLVTDCRYDIAVLRAIKSTDEIAIMQRAVDITVDGFSDLKKKLKIMKYEYEIEAEYSYAFKRYENSGHAYDPIVASGDRACTLHYTSNSHRLPQDGIVLIDIGASVDGYAADITRTYAIGTPTDRQKEVHAAVERAHHATIALLKPGLSVRDYHASVDDIMKHELLGLGLIASHDDDTGYRTYFPHAISHGLGIDVHDSLGRPTVLAAGMILTVEPGIYIPEEGIGVRIEDDILITGSGHRNLSAHLPTSL